MTVITPYQSDRQAGRDGFAELLHAEWTKFRTVRGWVIGAIVAIVVAAGIGLLSSGGSTTACQQVGSSGPARSGAACGPAFPVGPNGEPVSDSFYFVHQPLGGQWHHHRPDHLADRPDPGREPEHPDALDAAWPGGVGQGRDHHQGLGEPRDRRTRR